ncbi:hypothetical protein [Actinoalloteichus hymeniacidonis]|uniref:hypothetical protein n=1 Tax=Actinoalloteichus hymeniacidonis TaxID=340345 RepID=UPI0008539B47|nr:hypothetical protein [Actinoalloteichus hymeniacidonis]MBB5908258.1 bifunctional DNA-binding transcriptional regulator/antitoxin component of YhaV-PrlF toxin-antitoxin module [Actinoalloteichus hymeniacidonis]
MGAVDSRGRVADRSVLRALGWVAGTRIELCARDGLVVVERSASAVLLITVQGHLRLPAVIRHRVGLVAGDRVLLAADPVGDRLIVYPPSVLDDLLVVPHVVLSGGDLG